MTERRSMLPVSPRKISEPGKPRRRIEDESAIEEFYKLGDVLGKGSFGVVKEVTHLLTGKTYAMKIINKDKPGSMSIQLLDKEIEVLNRINHIHLIELIEVFETQKKVFIILEMCRGGELLDELKKKGRLHEDEVRVIMRQLSEAVVYMHRNDMVHRDLKLENILLSTDKSSEPYNIKVTDFGLSHMKALDGVNSDNSMYSRCGTLYYMAPEVLRSKHEYSQLCDVWSMGVIMYNLLCGCMPFNGESTAELEEGIMSGNIKFKEPEWISVSDQAKELIRGMLNTDTVKRFTARQVLEDPWITGSKDKQRIDPFNLLMEESPNPSPTTRPRSLTETITVEPHLPPLPSGSTSSGKFKPPADKKTTCSTVGSSSHHHPDRSMDSTTGSSSRQVKTPTRSKSLTSRHRSSQSTSRISSDSTKAGGSGESGVGGGMKKKNTTTVSSGQLLRPNTGHNGTATASSRHHEDSKRKLSSAKR